MRSFFGSGWGVWLLAGGVVFSACSHDNGGKAVNLKVTELEFVADTAQVGHPVSLVCTIDADGAVSNVGVVFVLMNKDDVDDDSGAQTVPATDIRQFYLGGQRYYQLESGSNTNLLTFNVPEEMADFPGDYYLLAMIDPYDEVNESDEQDNLAADQNFPSDVITVQADKVGVPDLVIQDLKLDSSATVLGEKGRAGLLGTVDGITDVAGGHYSGTLEIISIGGDAEDVPLTGCVILNDGSCRPVHFFDSDAGGYVDEITIPLLETDVPVSVPIDLLFPNDTVTALENDIDVNDSAQFLLRLRLNQDGAITEYETQENNNRHEATIYVYDAATNAVIAAADSDGVYFAKSYSKKFSNKYFGAGVEFDANASLTAVGAMGKAEGSVPVSIFKKSYKFIDASLYAHDNPVTPTDSQFEVQAEFAGIILYSKKEDTGYHWSKDWNVHKEKGYTDTIFIGVVPLEVTAGASGKLGFEATMSMEEKFIAHAGPYVDVGTYASAGVGALGFSAGVKGSLDLIGDTFTAKADAEMSLNDDETILTGTLDEKIYDDLDGPKGWFGLYLKWWTPKICWKWHVIPYPCGKHHHEKDLKLVKWHSYHKEDILLNESQTSDIQL